MMKGCIKAVIFCIFFTYSTGAEDPAGYDADIYKYDDYEDSDLGYNKEYTYEYIYEEDYEAVGTPLFVSEETQLLVDKGNTARLNCRVDNLGNMLIYWKREYPNGTQTPISMGKHLMLDDRRITVTLDNASSTLTIALLQEMDTGVYLCEVSSMPPLQQKHRVEIRSPARVEIEGGAESLELKEGDSLSLFCQGFGDPYPSIFWSRQNSLLPDGTTRLEMSRLEFPSVSGKHTGTYICTGNNGFGQPSTRAVNVIVKYAPVILLHQEYSEEGDLLLICVVKGHPEPQVSWSRFEDDLTTNGGEEDQSGKHVLRIVNPTKSASGDYTCSASNSEGTQSKDIHIQDSEFLRAEMSSSPLPSLIDSIKEDLSEVESLVERVTDGDYSSNQTKPKQYTSDQTKPNQYTSNQTKPVLTALVTLYCFLFIQLY